MNREVFKKARLYRNNPSANSASQIFLSSLRRWREIHRYSRRKYFSHNTKYRVNSNLVFRTANKFIFAQEFEKAAEILVRLIELLPFKYEFVFRYVEVATRLGSLQECRSQLSVKLVATQSQKLGRKRKFSEVSLQLGIALCDLRLDEAEREERENAQNPVLINPSLQSQEVVGLSAAAEQVLNKTREVRGLLAQVSGQNSQQKNFSITGKNLRWNRQPQFTDDFVEDDIFPTPIVAHENDYVNDAPGESQKSEFQNSESQRLSRKSTYFEGTLVKPYAKQVNRILNEFPNISAAHFVMGLILEAQGDLNAALESWELAYKINPKSLSVLSTLAELQQMGVIPEKILENEISHDYAEEFEALDKILVHGTFETHMDLYREFLHKGETKAAIASLRTLADWIARQRNEVPLDIEILCLLGAMRAYRENGQSQLAEECRKECETLTIALKREENSANQLVFVGQIAEEMGQPSLSKLCYLSVLTSPSTPLAVCLKTAGHCVIALPSESVAEALKTALRVHKGHSELKFCLLVCSLTLKNLSVKKYLERRNSAQQFIQKDQYSAAISMLNFCLKDWDGDSEVHGMLSTCYQALGMLSESGVHASKLYEIDSFSAEATVKYLNFLNLSRSFSKSVAVARSSLSQANIEKRFTAEILYLRATAYFALEEKTLAEVDIEKALQLYPWQESYLEFSLKCFAPENYGNSELFGKDLININDDNLPQWRLRIAACLSHGFTQYAYFASQLCLLRGEKTRESLQLHALCSSAWNSRSAAADCLQALNIPSQKFDFKFLACCISRTYLFDNQLELALEWVGIARRLQSEAVFVEEELSFVECFVLCLQGKNLQKAYSLSKLFKKSSSESLEGGSVRGVVENSKFSSYFQQEVFEKSLSAYLHLVCGETKLALEKRNLVFSSHKAELGFLSNVFLLKMCSFLREPLDKEILAVTLKHMPCNQLEMRLMEEVFTHFGLQISGSQANLVC